MVPLLCTIDAGSSHRPEKIPPSVSTPAPRWSKESTERRPTPTKPRLTKGWAEAGGASAGRVRRAARNRHFRFMRVVRVEVGLDGFASGFTCQHDDTAQP